MKISFLGAGNVAWHLSQAFENAGNSVQEVFSRDPKKAKELVSYLYNARVQEHLDFSESSSEVFFVCVPESAYAQVLPELILPKYGILVLVSGTAQLAESMLLYDPLRESMNQIGIFFPVQHVLTGRKINLSNTPICVEVLVEETETTLLALAKDVSDVIYTVNSDERKKIHLATLLAGTFTQLLWNQAKELIISIDLEPQLIQGLVENYMKSFFSNHPISFSDEASKLQDGRVMIDQKALMARHEMQEIFKQMVALIKSQSLD